MSEKSLLDLLTSAKEKVTVEEGKPTLRRQWYEDNLPEGLDMGHVKRLDTYNAMAQVAGTSALGECALSLLTADDNLGYVDTELEFGSNSRMTNRVHRNASLGSGDKKRNRYGHCTPVIHSGDNPDLLEAISEIGRRATEAFGPKD